ncbi:aromatic ring-hydroxylating dioxygenase subunit alpha [Sphingobium sp. JS3065]|uniref:aromatic ring-hydroxylating oxygenase subunit alpha n=1 Tax=Sphingobium sp. JS3065 TaxID=2970925 RepID=UPI002264558E|nr:aromatic ring-hydroxylating dioxygenase subunit alpha [Sphingobium sp. JS3065]UZW57084.1 aromatic ring-hydroxylating dioxygenase subunit alpha [Sphingobium sp. JS3065]
MRVVSRRQDLQRGYGNEERPVTQILWDRDAVEKNAAMLAVGNHDPENQQVDFKRYYDAGFAAEEFENVFMKTWQFACRDEDLPNVGDRLAFPLGNRSFLIVRTAENEFKAYFNSCIHRGTRLCDDHASGDTIKCPYHAWEWKLDGSLKYIPSHWDFKAVTAKNGRLREANIGRWGGFIFINADPDAAPLEEALGPVIEHFAEFDYTKRYTAARFRRLVDANWKIVQEAFHESYHVIETHPEAVPYNGDSQSQYDVWDLPHGAIGRQVTPSAVPSMHADASATPLEAVNVYAQIMEQWHYPGAKLPDFDTSKDLRQQAAAWHREVQKQFYGVDCKAPDAVMLDAILYFVFPNYAFWLSESLPFVYRFTPHETDPQKSYYEVHMLLPYDESKPRPAPSPMVHLGNDASLKEHMPAFGFLAYVFDQDMANMPRVQQGLQAADPRRTHSQLGAYQEMIIQHWNALIDRKIAEGAAAKQAALNAG